MQYFMISNQTICTISLKRHLPTPEKPKKYYCGQWKQDNYQQGKGEIHNAYGDVYFGSWVNGSPQGYGVQKYNIGDLYIGNFHSGVVYGVGTYVFKSGVRVTGIFNTLTYISYCQVRYPNGNLLFGSSMYQLDLIMDAQASLVSGDMCQFSIEICLESNLTKVLMQQTHLDDTFLFLNKNDLKSYYVSKKNLILNLQVKLINKNVFTGIFTESTGSGQIQYENGDIFRGQFKNGFKVNGQISLKNGDEFIGEFRNDAFWSGKYSYCNGTVLEGQFGSGFDGRMIFTNGDYVQIKCGSGINEMSKWNRFMGVEFEGIGDVFRVK
ncbi:MORN_motif precursor [Hexamita inflata]|uniref:MORN motif n=1 Tax=Hexamita inflata TaxID=28002 RepID=A0AA86RR81_9EUKA|nr:MORN motif precursor [Hexamita inflata]